jgi:hypothetical protein
VSILPATDGGVSTPEPGHFEKTQKSACFTGFSLS